VVSKQVEIRFENHKLRTRSERVLGHVKETPLTTRSLLEIEGAYEARHRLVYIRLLILVLLIVQYGVGGPKSIAYSLQA
jgi:hypothetical protein